MQIINHAQAEEIMRAQGGKLFAVKFVKRSNGAPRRMTCRLGVQKGVNGEGKKFNDRDHNLLTVHEFVSQRGEGNLHRCENTQFRSVPLERVTWIKAGGTEYEVQA